MSDQAKKAVRGSETFWQLDGESEIYAATIPDPPKSGAGTIVRFTHSNSYGPFDDVAFFVRVGDPKNPTDQEDLKSHKDWIQAQLVEELVNIDGEEMLRSEAEEPFDGEVPWEGTYEAKLSIPAGLRSIEIKVISPQPDLLRSLVLADWTVTVG